MEIGTVSSDIPREKVVVLRADNVYTSQGNSITGYVVIKDGIIASVSETLPPEYARAPSENSLGSSCSDAAVQFADITGHWIAPGFVDLHNHGCGGKSKVEEFWLCDYSAQNHIRYGTTSTLASLTFSKDTQLLARIIDFLSTRVGRVFPNRTVIEGIHAEGPLIRSRGALPDSHPFPLEDFKKFVDALPLLKVMTVSPSLESPVNFERMKYLFEKNVLVAIGHDNETNEDEILQAMRLAHTYGRPLHVTHLFNVSKFHHRDMGIVNLALLNLARPDGFPAAALHASQHAETNGANNALSNKYADLVEPSIEIIGDFIHVHPLVVQMALQLKNPEKICFITDAIADHNDKNYRTQSISMNGRDISITKEGVFIANTQNMAGSCTNQLEIFHNLTRALHLPIATAFRMLSENPAHYVGLNHIGTIEVGKQANLLVFDKQMNLSHVLLNGETVVFDEIQYCS